MSDIDLTAIFKQGFDAAYADGVPSIATWRGLKAVEAQIRAQIAADIQAHRDGIDTYLRESGDIDLDGEWDCRREALDLAIKTARGDL